MMISIKVIGDHSKLTRDLKETRNTTEKMRFTMKTTDLHLDNNNKDINHLHNNLSINNSQLGNKQTEMYQDNMLNKDLNSFTTSIPSKWDQTKGTFSNFK